MLANFLSRFAGIYLVFEALQTTMAHFCFGLVRIKMPLFLHVSRHFQLRMAREILKFLRFRLLVF